MQLAYRAIYVLEEQIREFCDNEQPEDEDGAAIAEAKRRLLKEIG